MLAKITNKLKSILIKYRSMPKRAFYYKVFKFTLKFLMLKVANVRFRLFDARVYVSSDSEFKSLKFCDNIDFKLDENFKYEVHKNLNGIYDLLGQGPINFNFDKNEEDIHINKQKRVFKQHSMYVKSLISGDYKFKDWFKNYKGQVSWDSNCLSSNIKYGLVIGSDIKYPWEFSRLAHLTQFALYCKSDQKDIEFNNILILEIKNQILDFYLSNPVGYGPNWMCPMDVGIRIVNIILSLSIVGDVFKNDFQFIKIVNNLLQSHQDFILKNLEYSPELTSNHYVANIVSLLFTSLCSQTSKKTNLILKFSLVEIDREIKNQYLDDGYSYELTSSYHRLTTEMFVYAASLISGYSHDIRIRLMDVVDKNWRYFPKIQKFDYENRSSLLSQDALDKLQLACLCDIVTTKLNGEVPQLGDNDSGRFIKASVYGELIDFKEAYEKYDNLNAFPLSYYTPFQNKFFDESFLNHKSLHIKYESLFGGNLSQSPESFLIYNLSLGNTYVRTKNHNYHLTSSFSVDKIPFIEQNNVRKKITIKFPHKSFTVNNLRAYFFGSSKVLTIKGDGLFLMLYALPNGSGAHTHNDALSFEMFFQDLDLVVDPGTYLYTSNPQFRNLFRSSSSHNTIRTSIEPNDFFGEANYLFSKELTSNSGFKNLVIEKDFIQADIFHFFKGVKSSRSIFISDNLVTILDSSNVFFDNTFNPSMYYSKSFGMLEKNVFNEKFKLKSVNLFYE